jgi:hypothetical protein
LKNSNSKNQLVIAILASIFVGTVSQIITYIYSFNFAYRDAIYRLEAARRFFDSLNPGFISQLGTVWLPVTHLIMAPFAYFDYLWTTGLAASIVGFVCFIFNSIFIFLILKKYFRNNFVIWIGFLSFILNPNLLYFQTTALTEQPYLLFITACFYFIVEWTFSRENKKLFISGFFLMLAMGTRYDGWILFSAAFVLIFLTAEGIINKLKSLLTFSIIPLIFLVLWFLYNLIYFGDLLEFSRGKYSTLEQLKYYEEVGRLPTKHNIGISFDVTVKDISAYIGITLTLISLISILIYTFKSKFKITLLTPYLLLIPLPAMFLLLYAGQTIIEMPNTNPPGYFNSRYGIYILPAIPFFAAYLINILIENKTRLKKILLYIVIFGFLFQQFDYYYYFPHHIPGVAEAIFCNNETNQRFSEYLKNNYDDGKIFYDFAIFAIPPFTKINIKNRINYNTADIGREALKNPKPYAKWVMFYTKASNDSVYYYLKNNKQFFNDYEKVFNYEGAEIYKIK